MLLASRGGVFERPPAGAQTICGGRRGDLPFGLLRAWGVYGDPTRQWPRRRRATAVDFLKVSKYAPCSA